MPRLREEKRLREQRLTGIKTGIPTYVPPLLTVKGFKLIFYDTSQVKVGEFGADVQLGRISEIEFELMDFGCGAFSFILDSLPPFPVSYRTRVDVHPYFDTTPWFSGFIQTTPKPGQKPPYRYIGFGFFEQLDWVTVTASYQSQEVSLIVKDIIQNIVAPSTQIGYNASKIEATTYTVTDITFDYAFAKDALQQLANIAQGYEFGVDDAREFYFRAIDTEPHYFYWAGRQFQDVDLEEDPQGIRNKLYVKSGKIQEGGTNIVGSVSDPGSISAYGLREEVVTAPDILNSDDALQWAGQVLAEKKDTKVKAKIKNVLFDTTKAKIEARGKIVITTFDGSVYTAPLMRVLYRISSAGTLGEIECGAVLIPFEQQFVGQLKRMDDEQRLSDKRTEELSTEISAEAAKVSPLILDTATAQLTIENTASEVTLYSYAFGAGELGANDAVRVIVCCRFLNQTGGARGFTLGIKLGGTTIYADATKAFSSGASYRAWFVRFILNNLGSLSSQALNGSVEISNTQGTMTGLGDLSGAAVLDGESPIHGVASENMAVAKTLSITVQFPIALANLKIDRYFAMVEKLPTV
jgi:hypothetical protein